MAEAASTWSRPRPAAALALRTGAWYGDASLDLELPEAWDVTAFSPATGAVLTDAEISARLASPVGQRPISERCSPATRPLIVVDDLNRPTPASRVLPLLVRQFTDAGVALGNITILIGPGTHAPPHPDAVAKKVGPDLAQACRLLVHHSHRPVVKVGRTSFGTPILVPREVLTSDFVVGIGGIYPNHTGGFGGGSKIALGTLGLRSIAALHFGHESVGWGSRVTGDGFRRDLDEIAARIGLETGVFTVLNEAREIVELACGPVPAVHRHLVSTATAGFCAPRPDQEVRIVISNAYPNDLSLTFVRMKGMGPIAAAPATASRVVVASCPEGLGFHGLFPFLNAPRFHRERMLGLRIAANLNQPRRLARKGAIRLARRGGARRRGAPRASAALPPTWLYCPSPDSLALLPSSIPGFRATSSWSEVVEGITAEQHGDAPLRTSVYTAAPLQWFA